MGIDWVYHFDGGMGLDFSLEFYMSTKETGGPAFPTDDGKNIREGMTLRDYFAAKALALCFDYCTTAEKAATTAYKMADAMLEARK